MSEKKSNIHILLVPLFLLLAPIVILSLVLITDSTAEKILKKDYPRKYWSRKIKVMKSRLEANNDERDNLIMRIRTREKKTNVASLNLSGAERETLEYLNSDIEKDEAGLRKAYEARGAIN